MLYSSERLIMFKQLIGKCIETSSLNYYRISQNSLYSWMVDKLTTTLTSCLLKYSIHTYFHLYHFFKPLFPRSVKVLQRVLGILLYPVLKPGVSIPTQASNAFFPTSFHFNFLY